MENLWFGILTQVICIGGFIIGFILFSKRKTTLALMCIIISGFLLRVYTSTDLYLHPWDERYHALVAKNMISEPLHPKLYENPVLPYAYTNWEGNHTWLHKQPVPLWTMAASMYLFGVNEIALRLPSILLTTLGILLMFLIARSLFNDRVAIISAFLYAIHGLIIELTAGRIATDHTDVFFLVFIQLAVWMAIRFFESRQFLFNVLCGVAIGLAVLSKWLPALIVLPIWLLLALDQKQFTTRELFRHFSILCFTIAVVALPWQIYILTVFPREAAWEYAFNIKHINQALESHDHPFLFHFGKMRILFGELIYLPLVWFIWKSLTRLKNYKRIMLVVWIMVPYLFFSFTKTKMQAYTIFTAPALLMVTALFWHYLSIYIKRFRFRWLPIMVLVLLIALPVRYSIERIQPFDIKVRNPGWTQDLRHLAQITQGENKVVVFNASHPIEAMFYANCTAYSFVPDAGIIAGLQKSGYKVLILKNE